MLQFSGAGSSGGFDHNQVAPDALTFADCMKLSLNSLTHFLYLPGVNDIHANMETATLAPERFLEYRPKILSFRGRTYHGLGRVRLSRRVNLLHGATFKQFHATGAQKPLH